MRLAGTCSRYSNSAMPQLTSAATIQGFWFRCLRCAYHANVMNTFDSVSSTTVSHDRIHHGSPAIIGTSTRRRTGAARIAPVAARSRRRRPACTARNRARGAQSHAGSKNFCGARRAAQPLADVADVGRLAAQALQRAAPRTDRLPRSARAPRAPCARASRAAGARDCDVAHDGAGVDQRAGDDLVGAASRCVRPWVPECVVWMSVRPRRSSRSRSAGELPQSKPGSGRAWRSPISSQSGWRRLSSRASSIVGDRNDRRARRGRTRAPRARTRGRRR